MIPMKLRYQQFIYSHNVSLSSLNYVDWKERKDSKMALMGSCDESYSGSLILIWFCVLYCVFPKNIPHFVLTNYTFHQ
jgi:hypothetical protein